MKPLIHAWTQELKLFLKEAPEITIAALIIGLGFLALWATQ